jgi:hydrogenase maturation protein HypF
MHDVRVGVRIRGTVQGVGFRPTVYRVARSLGLGGFVRNDDDGVWAELEGPAPDVARFESALADELPALARIDTLETRTLTPCGELDFVVEATRRAGTAHTRIPVDVAPCADCLRELFDPRDRRFRYPFINCTACGPRYTIIRRLPYDRERTTMASFALCGRCRAEYQDPADRRFHAEPNACPDCGPRLGWSGAGEPLPAAVDCLRSGGIVALRGVGGFLLAVDARDQHAVERLRLRKRRPHKPFALMARDFDEVERIAILDDAARAALSSRTRPIVLLPARESDVAPAVAPGLVELGVMLPSTPLHHLLLTDGPPLLVMTSGNHADEPLAKDVADASARLGDIADGFLTHDRPIHTRADDSVVRVTGGEARFIRRARGVAPEPIRLPFEAGCVLAVGGELKSTVCLTRGDEAFVSQHLGDLSEPTAFALFDETIDKLASLYDLEPLCVAHDLHPDYRSTRWALEQPLPRVAVQHHHAHVASCLAEHGRVGPAIGVAFDGTGCGPAGELWGGEFLLADLRGSCRVGHLSPLPLPGGEIAIRQPWRLAVAARLEAGLPIEHADHAQVARLVASPTFAPRATSAGRWFDAVAALLGVREIVSYEAQAAIELEAIAGGEADPLPFDLEHGDPFVIDLRPTVRAILRGGPRAELAAAFHETMAEAVLEGCRLARARSDLSTVALSGGCFQNARLTNRCRTLLEAAGFEVLIHRLVPPNDGGLSLGQAAVAAHRLQEERNVSRHSR